MRERRWGLRSRMDRKFFNVFMLGLAFMLLFTAFQTSSIIEKTVLESIRAEDPSFTADGYVSLAIIYAAFSVANWIAPSVISVVSPKWTMVIGASPYVVFIGSFLRPTTWLVYLMSALLGIGAALLWTGQGTYLTMNSDEDNMVRDSGIFWAMMQTSLLFGNLLVFFEFEGQKTIGLETRTTVFSALLAVAILGYLVFCVLRSYQPNRPGNTSSDDPEVLHTAGAVSSQIVRGPKEALVASAKLFVTMDMALLSVTFLYSGVEMSFFSGVYSAAIGFTDQLGADAARYIGISGMLIGAGEITEIYYMGQHLVEAVPVCVTACRNVN
ncbi:unnamed protein product [Notodromas monacha]|uniref:UNC93-like protein MFSD11 n=1 Tax=Notodromas monacha TaxID=399045 RepID=A0A7R9BVS7_9CRUS|nr:unnamed protein product [Notodromas monacha]CAG0922705.1 unnamed protein product [Notodromas monacha]